jgi:hypothetical protein
MLAGPLTRARPSSVSNLPVLLASFDPLLVRARLRMPLSLVTDQVIPLSEVAPNLVEAMSEQFALGSIDVISIPRIASPDRWHARLSLATDALRRGCSVATAAVAAHLCYQWTEG